MKTYSPSYTSGGLLLAPTISLIDNIISSDLNKVAFSKININSDAAKQRTLTELIKRFRHVPELKVWKAFSNSETKEKNLILYYICLKTYPMWFDFHFEIVLEKWKHMHVKIVKEDFLQFLERKIASHPEIEEWSDSTRIKAATVGIRMMREAGILIADQLQPPDVNPSAWHLFIEISEPWFLEAMFLNKSKRESIISEYERYR